LKEAKIFSIGAQKEYIIGGAPIGTIPDYYELGKKAATILDNKPIKMTNLIVLSDLNIVA